MCEDAEKLLVKRLSESPEGLWGSMVAALTARVCRLEPSNLQLLLTFAT